MRNKTTLKKGNKIAKKFDKTSGKKVCLDFFAHLRQGYSKESFPDADYRTVEKYISELNLQDEYDKAMREHQKFWEGLGIAKISTQYFNGFVWAMNMRNRFRWDKEENTGLVKKEIIMTFYSEEERERD